MEFNRLIWVIVFVVLNNYMVRAEVSINNINNSSSANVSVKDEKVETTAYHGKLIVSQCMNMLNAVLVKFPTTTLRMAMAADRGQKIVDAITKLKPIGLTERGEPVYFETKEQEQKYVKKQLEFVLEPVEKFMEDIKEHRNIVRHLLDDSLGAYVAKNSYISKALETEGSFLEYFNGTNKNGKIKEAAIKNVDELKNAATEFLMFFADVKASLSETAQAAYDKLIDKLTANKKQKDAAANK